MVEYFMENCYQSQCFLAEISTIRIIFREHFEQTIRVQNLIHCILLNNFPKCHLINESRHQNHRCMSFHKIMTIRHQCTLKPNHDEKEMKITPYGMEHVKHKRLSIHNSVNIVIETQFNGCFGRNIIIC